MEEQKQNSSSAPKQSAWQRFKEGFIARAKENTRSRWIRFSIVALIYTLWVVWLNNYWFLLGLILLFDIYITGYIPFTWWKKSPRKWVRVTMSWVDAIVYALILVYFIFTFLGQNYIIPSSSLEKTLLTGDYILVNKVKYGPRVPITPVHFPLVHNKLPWLGCNSYLSTPENKYRRLPGLRGVELGDIVVFNFPAGDTVLTKTEEGQNPNYSSVYYDVLNTYGYDFIAQHENELGKKAYRPVDRRTNYVKRVVGLPGQTFRIASDTIYVDGNALPMPKDAQFRQIAFLSRPLIHEDMDRYQISNEAMQMAAYFQVNEEMLQHLAQMGVQPDSAARTAMVLPLTSGNIEQMRADGLLLSNVKFNDYFVQSAGIFTDSLRQSWTPSNWGGPQGVTIPKKGMTIDITPESWTLYNRCIRNYEGHHDYAMHTDGVVRNGKGEPVEKYTFAMDYYFMMGDNRDNSLDSRFWGFVPEDHIVGTPLLVLTSFDNDNGGVRWSRTFHVPNPDRQTFSNLSK